MMWRSSRFKTEVLFALKAVSTLALLIALTQYWGHYYIEALLPLYSGVINLVLPEYQVVSLSFLQQQAEPIVAAHLIAIKTQIIGGHTLPINTTLDASTLAGHAYKHLIIVVSAVLIWPASTSLERGMRLIISFPLILLLESIDIPLAIAGAVQDLVLFNLSPNYATNKPFLVTWLRMLDGGGRLALSILAALVANLIAKSMK